MTISRVKFGFVMIGLSIFLGSSRNRVGKI
jgi:hypothetical protein